MHNSELQNRLFDSVLSAAIKENHINELSLIPSEKELKEKIKFSDEFEKRMQKLFNELKHKKRIKQFKLYTKRVAVILLTVVSVSFGAMMISPEVRATVQKTIMEWFDKYTSINFTESTCESLSDWKFDYIPKGYEKIDTICFENGISDVYTNKDNYNLTIEYTYLPIQYNANFDNEDVDYQTININGLDAYLFSKSNKNYILVFQKDNTVFNIFSDENDTNLLIEIAKNIKK